MNASAGNGPVVVADQTISDAARGMEFTPPPRSFRTPALFDSALSENAVTNHPNASCGLEFTPPPPQRPRNRQNAKPKVQGKFVSSPGMMESGLAEVPVLGSVQSPSTEMYPPTPSMVPCAGTLTKAPKTPSSPSTPSDIASSKWRTLRCPMAPCPRRSDHENSGLSTPCSGLITPSNVWNWSDTPGVQTPQPGEQYFRNDSEQNSDGATIPTHSGTQFGVSPASLSLALASAKLGATLPYQGGPSVRRSQFGQIKRSSTLEVCVETGLTLDSLPDLAPDVADDAVSEASSLSPRSIPSDRSDGGD